jgi:hypothetical protein
MKRNRAEDIALEKYFRWLERENLNANAYHVPNELPMGGAYAATLKRKGKKAGVSDIIIDVARKKYHGLRIEMKAPGGPVSFAQLVFMHNERNNGYLAVVAHGFEKAVEVTEWYFDDRRSAVDGVPLANKKTKRKGIEFEYKVVI